MKKLLKMIEKSVPKEECALLFSGGIDSLTLAMTLKKKKIKFKAFTIGIKGCSDISFAEKQSKEYSFNFAKKIISEKDIEKTIPELIEIIQEVNPIKTGIGLVKLLAIQQAKKQGYKKIIVGSGADELFAGYAKMRKDTEKQSKELVKNYWTDNKYLLKIAEKEKIELIFPYMNEDIVEFAEKLPLSEKISNETNKFILRKTAEKLGIHKEDAYRKKTAAQYGSGIDKIIEKLAKKEKKTKTQYLKDKFPIASLFSSGKDSCYSIQKITEKGFDVKCLITIKSRNDYSYMFHTPAVEIAELQAKAMNIPIMFFETEGKKEIELKDLKKAIKSAVEKHKIRGIVTGALYSEYQATRIQKICNELKIKCFNPLWHYNQEHEMREIIKDYEIMLTGVAAYGFDKSWLGRKITEKDVDKLVELNKKYGINIAGEGGEFESLVLNTPFFSKKIKITDYVIKEDGENTARLIIKKAELVEK